MRAGLQVLFSALNIHVSARFVFRVLSLKRLCFYVLCYQIVSIPFYRLLSGATG